MKFSLRKPLVFTLMAVALVAAADKITLLHTNDTHSSIDPDPKTGNGGILQRKAIFDSVRQADRNVLAIDAGDAVQGSLYFKFFKGDVEYPLMNMMDYDIRILGNHEFDNGLKDLAKYYRKVTATPLSTNYDFSKTELKGIFKPYVIKKIGGKKVGFIGININPESLIEKKNTGAMVYEDAIGKANETAAYLKKDKKCDLVVAVTHIGVSDKSGQPTDYDLARQSRDIDIIIGGHSHTLINPGQTGQYPNVVKNADGRDVLVAQTGKGGKFVGEISIDTDLLGQGVAAYDYKLLPVGNRFKSYDPAMQKFLEPYKHDVDSVNARVIGRADYTLHGDDRNGGYANLAGDFAMWFGRQVVDSVLPGRKIDLGIMNVGGIRHDMPAGDVTEGEILDTFPFANYMIIKELSGQDIIDAMKVAAKKGGEAVSGNVRVVCTPDSTVKQVIINGEPMDPNRQYVVSTISYLGDGNDNLKTLANGKLLWRDPMPDMSERILDYISSFGRLGLPVNPDPTPRFVREVVIDNK